MLPKRQCIESINRKHATDRTTIRMSPPGAVPTGGVDRNVNRVNPDEAALPYILKHGGTAMYDPEGEDLKTFIPGVGLLVTSWDGSEGGIFPIEEMAEVAEAEVKAAAKATAEEMAEEKELALQAQAAQYDDDLMFYEDNDDFIS